jgi:hypothetical protein
MNGLAVAAVAVIGILIGVLHIGIVLTVSSWIGPSPYMDEIFHIPQAQVFCVEGLVPSTSYNPKLTTLPGTYLFAAFLSSVGIIPSCNSTVHLRLVPAISATLSFIIVPFLLSEIKFMFINHKVSSTTTFLRSPTTSSTTTLASHGDNSSSPIGRWALSLGLAEDLIFAFRLALSPVRFFFAVTLFYTDATSSLFVLLAMLVSFTDANRTNGFYSHATDVTTAGAPAQPTAHNERLQLVVALMRMAFIAILDVCAVMCRQTNVVWIGFIGAMSAISHLPSHTTHRPTRHRQSHNHRVQAHPSNRPDASDTTLLQKSQSVGAEPNADPKSKDSNTGSDIGDCDAGSNASIESTLTSHIRMFVHALYTPSSPLHPHLWRCLLPHASVAIGFVIWVFAFNHGHITLGDSSNHQPSFHAIQIGYLVVCIVLQVSQFTDFRFKLDQYFAFFSHRISVVPAQLSYLFNHILYFFV